MLQATMTLNKSQGKRTNLSKTVSEYFAGIGLVRLGLENAGWNILFSNDFNPQKHEMYAAYFKDAEHHYSQESIFDLNPDDIPDTTLATASFPCIDLSLAGDRDGLAGKHSSAFWGLIRILEEKGDKKPALVLLENVPGWLTSNKGNDFRIAIQAMNNLGYACDVYSLDAARFGPQSRLRIFVIGVRTETINANIYSLLQRPNSLDVKAVKDAVLANSDLRWNFLDTPEPPIVPTTLSEIVEEMDENDPRWWSQIETDRHLLMMTPLHRERVEKLAIGEEWNYLTMYRRRRQGQTRAEVRNDDRAGCLRTAGGGSSRQMIVAGCRGLIKIRHMTPREYARLQGAPEDYPLPNNTIQALTGFGDAVSVPVIAWVAEHILNPLIEQDELARPPV